MKKIFPTFLLFTLFIASTAVSGPNLTDLNLDVMLFDGNSAYIGSDVNFEISRKPIPPGDYSMTVMNGNLSFSGTNLGQSVVAIPSSPTEYLTLNHSPYRGIFLVSVADGKLKIINRVPLEEYLYGVVAKEMPGADLEALKAQAVASRTLALNLLRQNKPIHASVSQQVYGGTAFERALAKQAVDDTRGLVLTYDGKLVSSPLFSSTCGGTTESSRDAFGKVIPYLSPVVDSEGGDPPYCSISPAFHWIVSWTSSELMENLKRYIAISASPMLARNRSLFVCSQTRKQAYGLARKLHSKIHGNLLEISPIMVDPYGHVKKLRIKTSEGTWYFKGFAIREILNQPNGKPLDSTRFTLTKQEENGDWHWIAEGYGKGHGVGLCQWGAIGMSRQGKDFKQILAHYYVGTQCDDISRVLGYNRGREVVWHLPLEEGSHRGVQTHTNAGLPRPGVLSKP